VVGLCSRPLILVGLLGAASGTVMPSREHEAMAGQSCIRAGTFPKSRLAMFALDGQKCCKVLAK